MYLELGSRPHVIISSSEMAREVLKEHDVEFASRPQYHTFFKNVSHGFNDLVFAPLVLFGRMFYGSDIPLTPEAEAYKAVSGVLVRESEKVYIGDFVPVVENFLNATIEEHKKEFDPEHPQDFVDVMLSLKLFQ